MEEFEEWWQSYPKKLAKGDARKAWKQTAKIRPPLAELIRAVNAARSCEQWTKDGGQFIPYPATWLRGERWDDVHEVSSQPKETPCGNCGLPLSGAWTQSPKGRVCNRCFQGYMSGAWPSKVVALRT